MMRYALTQIAANYCSLTTPIGIHFLKRHPPESLIATMGFLNCNHGNLEIWHSMKFFFPKNCASASGMWGKCSSRSRSLYSRRQHWNRYILLVDWHQASIVIIDGMNMKTSQTQTWRIQSNLPVDRTLKPINSICLWTSTLVWPNPDILLYQISYILWLCVSTSIFNRT